MWKRHWPIILVLILAFGLRIVAFNHFPPGLTHDEANHGREAIGILDGIYLFYFPLNYGSEPLYSYLVAASMALLGENLFALRLVNAIFGTAAVGATYAWVCQVLDRRTALVTAVLMAISFWPVATSRQALRAGLLPFFMVGTVWFYWQILFRARSPEISPGESFADNIKNPKGMVWPVIGFGVFVAITLHIYLAARVAWLLFPLFLVYLFFIHRALFRRVWLSTLAGLLLAAILVTPMFLYLDRYPYALTRLDMLDGPLQALGSGDLRPILQNSSHALLAFIWPGYGDQFLAYNIPGRPVFDALTAVFFIIGLVVSIWRWRQMKFAFLLIWFGSGILPSLITGATASTTRNLAALPATFVFPAIGFWAAAKLLKQRTPAYSRLMVRGGLILWLLLAGGLALWEYFVRWGESPEVRGAYQVNLVQALDWNSATDDPFVISTVYPGPAHDPSIARLLSAEPENRWVDARLALVLPGGQSTKAIIPASTRPHPVFTPFLSKIETVFLRPDDLDPSFTSYELDASQLGAYFGNTAVNLNNALILRHAGWLNPSIQPGDTAEMFTIWEVTDPTRVGPIVPPAFTTDVVMFTQVLGDDGRPLAQRDSLEAPSWDWQTGDIILQVHPIFIPSEMVPGQYPAIIGMYDKTSGERLVVLDEAGNPVGDKIAAPPLEVNAP